MDQKAFALGKPCDMKWSYCTFGWGGECGLSCRGVVSDLARGAGQMSVAVFSLGEASHKIC
jgi:hypothetical protein